MRKLLLAFSLTVAALPFGALAAGPCHGRCKELTKECEYRCKVEQPAFTRGRARCVDHCKARLHECAARCP